MSRPHEIRYLSTAERDLDDIFEYVRKDQPSAAKSLLEKFDKFGYGFSMQPHFFESRSAIKDCGNIPLV